MNVYVYENRDEALNLEPIALTRPGFDLRCGAFTFLERIQRLSHGSTLSVFVRDELTEVTRERFSDVVVNPQDVTKGIWLNGIFLWRREFMDELRSSSNTVLRCGERVVGVSLDEEKGRAWVERGSPVFEPPDKSLPSKEISAEPVAYLWDCVNLNGTALRQDADFFELGRKNGGVDQGVHLLNPSSIYVGKGSRVKAGAVLDAADGPIIIGENVTVLSGACLEGPLFVGDKSVIKVGAKIYGETSVGPGCKVGGEVEEAIFQSWSNKQHDGFLGHAYIGEWVNVGADTNNSDLKNNYSPVKVMINGRVVDTGSLFVGLFLGDHSKTGINTMFNTGTAVGPACNIVGSGFPSKSIPPFSWVVDGKIQTHLFEKFVETARAVKNRRDQSFSSAEEKLYRRLFKGRSA
ncbi:MAG: putative sugar nucleotidyl transferase [Candidatus Neomarinimicrobiota bacterium]